MTEIKITYNTIKTNYNKKTITEPEKNKCIVHGWSNHSVVSILFGNVEHTMKDNSINYCVSMSCQPWSVQFIQHLI